VLGAEGGEIRILLPDGLDEDVVIGRDEQVATLVITNDKLVSRKHAVIRKTKFNTYEIQDLGSANGTFVGGRPILKEKSTPLRLGGGRIQIGRVMISFCL
jgi:pSer/pThr/pTyr-binding forkhead associated (FHA) protein